MRGRSFRDTIIVKTIIRIFKTFKYVPENYFLFVFSFLAPLGSFDHPGISCKHIADSKSHPLTDGQYWIKPPGVKQLSVYCDMTTDEGKREYFGVKQTEKCYLERGCLSADYHYKPF